MLLYLPVAVIGYAIYGNGVYSPILCSLPRENWVQVAANWVCSFLYLWTLVVPYLCRHHRDFGVEFDL